MRWCVWGMVSVLIAPGWAAGNVPPVSSTAVQSVNGGEAASKQSRDAAALEAVMADLIAWKDGPYEPLEKPNRLYYYVEAKPSLLNEYQTQELTGRWNPKIWKKLTASQRREVHEAMGQVLSRCRKGDGPQPFTPKSRLMVPQIAHDLDMNNKFYSPLYRKKQIFSFYPPGFSPDGRLSVVCLHFSWSIHSGRSTYVLRRQRRGWKVLLHGFIIYV